jgi:peptidoglycan/LPS O-acetylase OafA/YrhL
LGVVSFAYMVCMLARKDGSLKRFLIRYSGYSFFVFAAHYPLLLFVAAFAQRVPGHGSALGFFFMWLLIPLVTVLLCILAAQVLERLVPSLFRLLNGGRSGREAQQRFEVKTAG